MTNLDCKIRPISDILAPEDVNLREPDRLDSHRVIAASAHVAAGHYDRATVAHQTADRLLNDVARAGLGITSVVIVEPQKLDPAPVSRLVEEVKDKYSREYVDALHEHDGGGNA